MTAIVVLLAATGCDGGVPEQRQIRIATGSTTAVYHAVGSALARIIERDLPEVDASVQVTAASAENVARVSRGEAEVGFTQADILDDGNSANLTALARVYDDLLHLIVRADSPIRTLADLRGRRVSVGAPGSGTEVTVNRLLTVGGLAGSGAIQQERMGIDESSAALTDGRIDAFFFSGGLPVGRIADLRAQVAPRLVDLSEWAEPLRDAYSDAYVVRDVPTSTYGLGAVSTVAVPNLLVVSGAMPDDLAYDLARLLLERRDELAAAHPAAEPLDFRSAIATAPLSLHPGAARYFKSVKP
ncbi:TAXI family TRAP transporter solute-binding subunit [Micromonospora sp. CPCC 206061]|uniref:TAXI family TRAP transporter solute-binding subunit n=1 Tax=Micromonospora sp. CPCC 206061 TaxID=3122410 RepID=UPI002FF2DA85